MDQIEQDVTDKKEVHTLPEIPRIPAPRVKITKLSDELELSEDAADQPCWG